VAGHLEEGVFSTAQVGSQAIVAYGLMPRGQRSVESLRLDIRLLGVDGEIEYQEGAVVFTDGEVYVGIVPLKPDNLGHSADVTVWRDGDETVISIINYEGPAKVFWEYRSLGGPFWKGNVRNGFVLWIASRGEFESESAFLSALQAIALSDEVEGTSRTIRFGDVTLEYDVRGMWP
jgi:hypothetical protein